MSRDGVELILRSAIESTSFASQLGSDASLLHGYDLTPDEIRALRAHDRAALLEMGVPEPLFEGLAAVPSR
jgi:hypothetical protein